MRWDEFPNLLDEPKLLPSLSGHGPTRSLVMRTDLVGSLGCRDMHVKGHRTPSFEATRSKFVESYGGFATSITYLGDILSYALRRCIP